MPRKRILLVASAGGHWVQLSRMSPAFDGHDTYYVTTMRGASPPSGDRPVRVIADASRSTPHRFVLLVLQVIWAQLTLRPDVIVTTGAAPGLIALQIGKLLGSKTVWVDSLANSEELSWSGRMARRFADLWLTQWPHLADHNSRLQFFGRVL
ncbi:UDP-N-acetylglucosamine--LPS N-acetylglucosamine transferase [Terrarubrum flagellatum]|uniref:UDP-N-acetylglucosamine--LPS N-acetylglucosamine transferase n=1 Tax=Terrirubrum flagellatum TaxID=2895980 RepID=UPI0031455FEE